MPIKLKYKNVNDRQFVNALAKLANHAFKDPRIAYNVAKIVRRFDSESQLAQELYVKLVKQWAVLDEKGNVKTNEHGQYDIPTEKAAEWTEARAKFDDIEFELDCHKVRLEQLENVGLTPVDLIALEPVLTELEVVSATTEEKAATA